MSRGTGDYKFQISTEAINTGKKYFHLVYFVPYETLKEYLQRW